MISNPYFWMTFIGLCVKLWATHKLYTTEKATKRNIIFFGLFLLVLYILSIFELANYYYLQSANVQTINFVMNGYYVSTFAAAVLLPLAIISLVRPLPAYICLISLVIFLVLNFILLFTELMVLGYKPIAYTFTRIPGDYYYVFQVYVLLSILISLVVLVAESRYAKDKIHQIKANNLLIGYLPSAVFVGSIMVLMGLGYEVNIVGPIPIMMAIFIIAITKNLHEENITDFRIYLPWTKEAKLVRQIAEPFCRLNYTNEIYKNNAKWYEQMLIQHAIDMFATHREAAKWLGISESKISRALKNHKNRQ